MSTHPDPELLAAVATGEQRTRDVAAHLGDCAACSADLDALRELSDSLATSAPVEWVEPPAHLWAAIAAGIADGMPDRGQTSSAGGPSRRGTWLVAAVAALVGVAAGVLGGRALWPAAPTQLVVVASASLNTLDDRRELGEATLLRANGEVELSVRTEPLDAGSGYLEVWLLNIDGVRMVSVGVLADNSTGVFPLPQGLLGQGYRVVDVSRESYDDKPTHSGDSLVRGELRV